MSELEEPKKEANTGASSRSETSTRRSNAPAAAAAASSTTPKRNERSVWWTIFIFIIIYYFVKLYVLPTPAPPQSLQSASYSLWNLGDSVELKVFLSEGLGSITANNLVWHEKDLIFGNTDESQYRHKELLVPVSETMRKSGGSLYAHIFLKRTNVLGFEDVKYNHVPLHYAMLRQLKKNEGGLGSALKSFKEATSRENPASPPPSSWWYPNMTIQWVADNSTLPVSSFAPFIKQHILSVNDSCHFPILFVNDFWHLKEYYLPVDASTQSLPLYLEFKPISFWRFQMSAQFSESCRLQEVNYGIDTEDIKRMICETNVILLTVTMIVSVLHTIFDILAFKNDIQFWKGRGNRLEGLSVRSIMLNAGSQLIIFLYLLEEETNVLILVSVAFGLLLELWKLTKAISFKTCSSFPYMTASYQPAYAASATRNHDETAIYYLTLLAVPLLFGYSIYAYYTEPYTRLYTFVLKTLVGFVYAFGFIMMTPQLFINYKLKSVAHMPWKAFMYKALNTFIDDLFAFVIRMPMLHRLACLRDDVIFLIYLYQRYLYPVDKKRMNEFGQKGEPEAEAVVATIASEPEEDSDSDSDSNAHSESDSTSEPEPVRATRMTRRSTQLVS